MTAPELKAETLPVAGESGTDGNYRCPNCGQGDMTVFYEVHDVPVHSVLLMDTRADAVNYPTGDIRLGTCAHCGFVSNVAFRPEVHEYSQRYESTQAYSPTFNKFHTDLAQRLIDRYALEGKQVVEIGCGQGEFLALLSRLGNVQGIGFDPAYAGRVPEAADDPNLTFISDFYAEKYTSYTGDFICCKMTLEHIPNTAEFLQTVRRSIGDRPNATVFFQIPNGGYVLNDLAFWDVYYEHCSYFTPVSLRYLFESSGFQVLDVATQYDDQYLTIEARPVSVAANASAPVDADALAAVMQSVDYFGDNVLAKLHYWQHKLQHLQQQGKRAVIWGSGSKGVAFLTSVGLRDQIGYAVDINPKRHGTFMTGTGHEIVGPEFLVDYRPDLVIVMNPIYKPEIERDLARLGVVAEVLTV